MADLIFSLVMSRMGIPFGFLHIVSEQTVSLAPSRRSRRDLRPVCEAAHDVLTE